MQNFGPAPLRLVYELNEVPWRVVDWYVARNPHSHLAQLLQRSSKFTTVTPDDGELHPWTTWPTLHQGVTNAVHNISFINQSLSQAQAYPPVWQTLKEAGKRVGAFGSLQSYSPPSDGGYDFYVPDTLRLALKHGQGSTKPFSALTYAKPSKTARRQAR